MEAGESWLKELGVDEKAKIELCVIRQIFDFKNYID
jgi:hypothetical protein